MRPIKIIRDKTYKHMYWLVWEDGVTSAWFYNKTWAKRHIRFGDEEFIPSIDSRMPFKRPQKPAGAFK